MYTNIGSNAELRWQNMLTWMRAQTYDKLTQPHLEARINELRFLLYMVESPFIPLQVQLQASTAKYIVQKYIAATRGQAALKAVHNICVTGEVKIKASEFHEEEQTLDVKCSEETGGFVLWQNDLDLWMLELLVSGCQVICGSNGKISWRHSSNQRRLISKGPPRPLRQFLQGLDPRSTTNLFLDATCNLLTTREKWKSIGKLMRLTSTTSTYRV